MVKLLEFEQPLYELYEKIEELKRLAETGQVDLSEEIVKIEARAEMLKKEIYTDLSPNQIIQISRHPSRPDTLGLSKLIFDEFMELHGDRQFRDDPSIVGGVASLNNDRLMVIGHQKGHDTKENIHRNFGMPHPEGYRKALRLMKLAEKFNMPIITFVDTPGAFPGKEAEERGQAEAIARNLREMTGLKVPVITFVIGEGGSGGALGIAVSNKVYMLEYAVYSVISPEGCASILFRDSTKSNLAADSLKITAPDIVKLGVAEDIIVEPLGGAHRDWCSLAESMKNAILGDLKHYKSVQPQDIISQRYQKFRKLGQFDE